MPWEEFEHMIPASEQAKTVHALDRAATVTGHTLELVRDNYIRKAEQYYSEQQCPPSQQPVHLMMAG
jgi:hypothetical protein